MTVEIGARHEPCSSNPCTPASPDGPVPRPDGDFSARTLSFPCTSFADAECQRSAAQRLCNDDQQRRSQGEMGRTEGLCEGLQHVSRHAKAQRCYSSFSYTRCPWGPPCTRAAPSPLCKSARLRALGVKRRATSKKSAQAVRSGNINMHEALPGTGIVPSRLTSYARPCTPYTVCSPHADALLEL